MNVENWKSALSKAIPDETVGIRIAPLTAEDNFSMHVTEIPFKGKVGAHFHKEGVEIYQILSGRGIMYTSEVKDVTTVAATKSIMVSSGDFFTVPPMTAHQLVNTGDEPLVLVFGCPESHLSTDRIIVDDLCE